MPALHRVLPLVWLIAAWNPASSIVMGDDPASSGPAIAQSTAGFVTLAGTVRMPDGQPAVGAIVKSTSQSEEPTAFARTNHAGRFEVRGVWGHGASLHIMSADGNHQATLKVPAVAIRVTSASPSR